MVNKIRLFSYVFTYSGGAHKAIKGHHTFFMNDPEKIGSAMNHLKTEGKLNEFMQWRVVVSLQHRGKLQERGAV